jgi:hypothetical protein
MAKKKKLSACDAKKLLEAEGIPFGVDVHSIGVANLGRVAEVAKQAGYRKPKNAPGSTGRMYYQYLNRLKSCQR